jgi:hypothetical protein
VSIDTARPEKLAAPCTCPVDSDREIDDGGGGAGRRGREAAPFGGVKASGYGRAGGRAGVQELISSKNISIGLS